MELVDFIESGLINDNHIIEVILDDGEDSEQFKPSEYDGYEDYLNYSLIEVSSVDNKVI